MFCERRGVEASSKDAKKVLSSITKDDEVEKHYFCETICTTSRRVCMKRVEEDETYCHVHNPERKCQGYTLKLAKCGNVAKVGEAYCYRHEPKEVIEPPSEEFSKAWKATFGKSKPHTPEYVVDSEEEEPRKKNSKNHSKKSKRNAVQGEVQAKENIKWEKDPFDKTLEYSTNVTVNGKQLLKKRKEDVVVALLNEEQLADEHEYKAGKKSKMSAKEKEEIFTMGFVPDVEYHKSSTKITKSRKVESSSEDDEPVPKKHSEKSQRDESSDDERESEGDSSDEWSLDEKVAMVEAYKEHPSILVHILQMFHDRVTGEVQKSFSGVNRPGEKVYNAYRTIVNKAADLRKKIEKGQNADTYTDACKLEKKIKWFDDNYAQEFIALDIKGTLRDLQATLLPIVDESSDDDSAEDCEDVKDDCTDVDRDVEDDPNANALVLKMNDDVEELDIRGTSSTSMVDDERNVEDVDIVKSGNRYLSEEEIERILSTDLYAEYETAEDMAFLQAMGELYAKIQVITCWVDEEYDPSDERYEEFQRIIGTLYGEYERYEDQHEEKYGTLKPRVRILQTFVDVARKNKKIILGNLYDDVVDGLAGKSYMSKGKEVPKRIRHVTVETEDEATVAPMPKKEVGLRKRRPGRS